MTAVLGAGRSTREGDWSRFLRWLVSSAALSFVLALLFLLAVDPYDSGRTGLFAGSGVPSQFPTTANASRARDPSFDAAIFGNSHIQQVSPERLRALTGLAPVSLIIPGTGPADQLAVLGRFLATRTRPPRAIVIGTDAFWCRPTMEFLPRFPAWLYDPSFLVYLGGLVRYRSIEAAFSRLAFLRSGQGGARRDGYWDYRPYFAEVGLEDQQASRRRVLEDPGLSFGPNPQGVFPAFEALRQLLRRAPAETIFVLVRPPVYASSFPAPGTAEARTQEKCRQAIGEIAAEFPSVRLIDLLEPGPIASDVDNFYDREHYRDPIAAEIERRIAEELRRQPPAGRGG